jgi:hypothetical protein
MDSPSTRKSGARSGRSIEPQGPECSVTRRVHCRSCEGLRNKIVAGDPSPGSWSRHYMCAKPVTIQLDDFLMVARQVSMAGRRKLLMAGMRQTLLRLRCCPRFALSPCIFATYEWFWGPSQGAARTRPGLGPAPGNPGGLMGNVRGCPPGARRPTRPGYRGGPLATEVGVLEPAGNVDHGKRCR